MKLLMKILRELGFGFVFWASFITVFGILPQKPLTLNYMLEAILVILLPFIIIIAIRMLVRKFLGAKYASIVPWLIWMAVINFIVFGSQLKNRLKPLDENSLPLNMNNFLLLQGLFVVTPWLLSLMIKRSRKSSRAERKQRVTERKSKIAPDTFKQFGVFNISQWILFLIFLFSTFNFVRLLIKSLSLPTGQTVSPADEHIGTIYMTLTGALFIILLAMKFIRAWVNKKAYKNSLSN